MKVAAALVVDIGSVEAKNQVESVVETEVWKEVGEGSGRKSVIQPCDVADMKGEKSYISVSCVVGDEIYSGNEGDSVSRKVQLELGNVGYVKAVLKYENLRVAGSLCSEIVGANGTQSTDVPRGLSLSAYGNSVLLWVGEGVYWWRNGGRRELARRRAVCAEIHSQLPIEVFPPRAADRDGDSDSDGVSHAILTHDGSQEGPPPQNRLSLSASAYLQDCILSSPTSALEIDLDLLRLRLSFTRTVQQQRDCVTARLERPGWSYLSNRGLRDKKEGSSASFLFAVVDIFRSWGRWLDSLVATLILLILLAVASLQLLRWLADRGRREMRRLHMKTFLDTQLLLPLLCSPVHRVNAGTVIEGDNLNLDQEATVSESPSEVNATPLNNDRETYPVNSKEGNGIVASNGNMNSSSVNGSLSGSSTSSGIPEGSREPPPSLSPQTQRRGGEFHYLAAHFDLADIPTSTLTPVVEALPLTFPVVEALRVSRMLEPTTITTTTTTTTIAHTTTPFPPPITTTPTTHTTTPTAHTTTPSTTSSTTHIPVPAKPPSHRASPKVRQPHSQKDSSPSQSHSKSHSHSRPTTSSSPLSALPAKQSSNSHSRKNQPALVSLEKPAPSIGSGAPSLNLSVAPVAGHGGPKRIIQNKYAEPATLAPWAIAKSVESSASINSTVVRTDAIDVDVVANDGMTLIKESITNKDSVGNKDSLPYPAVAKSEVPLTQLASNEEREKRREIERKEESQLPATALPVEEVGWSGGEKDTVLSLSNSNGDGDRTDKFNTVLSDASRNTSPLSPLPPSPTVDSYSQGDIEPDDNPEPTSMMFFESPGARFGILEDLAWATAATSYSQHSTATSAATSYSQHSAATSAATSYSQHSTATSAATSYSQHSTSTASSYSKHSTATDKPNTHPYPSPSAVVGEVSHDSRLSPPGYFGWPEASSSSSFSSSLFALPPLPDPPTETETYPYRSFYDSDFPPDDPLFHYRQPHQRSGVSDLLGLVGDSATASRVRQRLGQGTPNLLGHLLDEMSADDDESGDRYGFGYGGDVSMQRMALSLGYGFAGQSYSDHPIPPVRPPVQRAAPALSTYPQHPGQVPSLRQMAVTTGVTHAHTTSALLPLSTAPLPNTAPSFHPTQLSSRPPPPGFESPRVKE